VPEAAVDQGSSSSPSSLLAATETVFDPLAQLLVRSGVPVFEAVRPLTRAYVRALRSFFADRGWPVTVPRIAAWAGIPRGQAGVLLESIDTPSLQIGEKLHGVAAVLTGWSQDEEFSVPFVGTPSDLPIVSKAGATNKQSFQRLAEKYAPKFDFVTLLDELVRLGNVRVDNELNTVRLLKKEYVGQPQDDAFAEHAALALANLSTTIQRNLRDPENGRFERSVFSDVPMSEKTAIEFDELLRSEGKALMDRIDKWFSEQPQDEAAGKRIGVSIFYFEREIEAPSTVKQLVDDVSVRREREASVASQEIDVLTFDPHGVRK
jgi:hypothetical protein